MRKADASMSTIQFSIRVPRDWPKRADKLIKKLAPPGMKFTRMDVFRAAILTGFEQLEQREEKNP
jgi:hypothetical protein